jgi:hypothetical protein
MFLRRRASTHAGRAGTSTVLTPEDFTAVPVSSWPVSRNLIFIGFRSVGDYASDGGFGTFGGQAYHVNGATKDANRPNSAAVAFPGGTVGYVSPSAVAYTLPAGKITVTPTLIDSYGGDGDISITVTDQQVITGNGVTYNRQSKDSIIACAGYLDPGTILVNNRGAFRQLFPGRYTFTDQYITWHYSQYVGYYMIFEF